MWYNMLMNEEPVSEKAYSFNSRSADLYVKSKMIHKNNPLGGYFLIGLII